MLLLLLLIFDTVNLGSKSSIPPFSFSLLLMLLSFATPTAAVSSSGNNSTAFVEHCTMIKFESTTKSVPHVWIRFTICIGSRSHVNVGVKSAKSLSSFDEDAMSLLLLVEEVIVCINSTSFLSTSNVVLWFVVVVHKPFHGNPDSLCTFPKDLSVIKMSFHIDTYLLCWIP